jgi:hypothetical protein
MDTNDMSKKIKELMEKEGKSLEEALAIVMKGVVPSNKIVDRVAHIRGLSNLVELRNATKIAFAKKSKSKDNPEAVKRYELEIKAGQDRLNELLAEIDQHEHRCLRALELGESPEGAVQLWLEDMEARTNRALEDYIVETRSSRASIRRAIGDQKTETPESLIENLNSHDARLLPIYENRLSRGDQRVATLNRKIRLKETFKSK